jgi:hypothetical protein
MTETEPRSKAKGRLRALGAWRALIDETDPAMLFERFAALRAELPQDCVGELVEVAADGSEVERLRAHGVLSGLLYSRDVRLEPKQRAKWSRLALACAREEYPKTVLGTVLMAALIGESAATALDRDGAQQILVHLDTHALSDMERLQVARDLTKLRTPESVEQLKRIQAFGLTAGTYAAETLAAWGVVDMRRVKTLAREWRAKRAGGALGALYHQYLVCQVGELTIRDAAKLLGPPDDKIGSRHLVYRSRDGKSLKLIADERGILSEAVM